MIKQLKVLSLSGWFEDLDKVSQDAYIEQHPGSRYAKQGSGSGAAKKTKDPMAKIVPKLTTPGHERTKQIIEAPRKSWEGHTLDGYVTPNGSVLVGVEHESKDDEWDGEPGNFKGAKTALKAIFKSIPKDQSVVYLTEGGTGKDNLAVPGSEQEYMAGQITKHYPNSEVDTWDGPDNDPSNPDAAMWDHIDKTTGSRSKSRAALFANMVGQGDELDADEWVDKEGQTFINKQLKASKLKPIDWDNITDEDYENCYKISFPQDFDQPQNPMSEAGEAIHNHRRKTMNSKIKEYEAKGIKVIVTPGSSHVQSYKQEYS